jgi:predicted enzyme related to lactoylglutathione lyase
LERGFEQSRCDDSRRVVSQVPDLDAFHRRMVEHGVACLEEPRDVFGSRIALYADPDGLPISVGEERA